MSTKKGHTQHPQNVKVCAGILANPINGPLFIDENLKIELQTQIYDERYLVLQEVLLHFH